jgi:hypothetical protein
MIILIRPPTRIDLEADGGRMAESFGNSRNALPLAYPYRRGVMSHQVPTAAEVEFCCLHGCSERLIGRSSPDRKTTLILKHEPISTSQTELFDMGR